MLCWLVMFIKTLEFVFLETYWIWLMLLYFHLLKQILGSHDEIRIFHDEKQIKPFQENLFFLLSFLEDSSPRNTESLTRLEARIRDATYEAEDIIELHMSNPILSESATHEAEDKIELHMSKEILSESATYEAVDIMDMSKDILSDIIDLHKSKEILSESATYEAVDLIDMSKEILSKPATYEAVDIIDMSKEILSESATYEAVDVIDLHMSEEILFKDLVELHMSKRIPLFHNSEKYEGLQKAIKEIDSILVDAKKMNDIEGLSKSSLLEKKWFNGSTLSPNFSGTHLLNNTGPSIFTFYSAR